MRIPWAADTLAAVPALTLFLAVAGAFITVAAAMIGGLKFHAALERYLPRLAIWVPREICVAAGLIAGCSAVMGWIVNP